MMVDSDYDVLAEAEDPDVAFLSGSGDVEIRSKRRRRGSKSPKPKGRTSRCCAPILWIVMLCMLLGGLVVMLTIILYHKSDRVALLSLRDTQSTSSVDLGISAGSFPASSGDMSRFIPHGVKPTRPPLKESSGTVKECMWQRNRLPRSLVPKLYNLHLHPNLVTEKYSGLVEIEVAVIQKTSLVVLHAKNLSIQSAIIREVGKEGQKDETFSRLQSCTALDQLQLSSRRMLLPENRYILAIHFDSILPHSMDGFYISNYEDDNGKSGKLATTQFEPVYARNAFPCFDEPDFKAVFRLEMTHDKDMVALSNSPVDKQIISRTNTELMETTFKDTMSMSTYLLAFTVCDFGSREIIKSGLEFHVYAVQHKVNQTELALKTAVDVVDFYQGFFNIPYPLKKLDLIAIPDFAAGAMENWGLITFRESTLLFDTAESGLEQRDLVSQVVSHEVAHQWFGNLVTMTWWDQLWLNEGFATYMEYLGMNASDPALGAMQQFAVDTIQPALHKDALQTTHAIVANVEDPAEIEARFDEISYSKGASVLWMLHDGLGEEVFRNGVTDYLVRHEYENAETSDLWNALDAAWQKSRNEKVLTVQAIADSWTSQPGFPLVSASRTGNTITLIQERFVPLVNYTIPGAKWNIPICVVTSTGSGDRKEWFGGVTTTITLPEKSNSRWYKLKQLGFYRVNYDEKNWIAITGDLVKDPSVVLTPEDRGNLLDDAFALARGGKLKISIAMDLISYLIKETHFLPWASVASYMEGTESILFETASFRKFRKWRRSLVQPIFSRLSCLNATFDTISQRRLCIHLSAEACRIGVPECVSEARDLFSLLVKDGRSVPVDTRRIVYTAAVASGTEEDWDFLWKRFQSTPVASEKNLILAALGSTQDPWLIQRYIQYSLDTRLVRSSETLTVLMGLSINYLARGEVWKAIRQNWDLFLKRYGNDTTIAHFFTCLQWMTSEHDLRELRSFFEFPGRNLGAGILAYNETVEIIGLNRKFLNLYANDLTTWLNSK